MLSEAMPSPMLLAAAEDVAELFPPEWPLKRCFKALLHPRTFSAELRVGWYEHWRNELPVADPERHANDPLDGVLIHVVDGHDDLLPSTEQLLAVDLAAVDAEFEAAYGPYRFLWDREDCAEYVAARELALARYHPRRPS